MSAERMVSLAPILVVDDEGPVRDLLTTILEECGYPCLAGADVAAAKQALRQIPVEMVLTDRDMPGETGIDLIRHIKAHHPDTGVIMVTVIDDIDQAREALDLGVYGYITKPFTRNQVLITVENGLRHRQTALENRHHAARLEDLVRRRTEALNEQLNLLRTLLDTSPAPVFYKDTDGVYLGCNQAFEEAVGRPRGAFAAAGAGAAMLVLGDLALIPVYGVAGAALALACGDGLDLQRHQGLAAQLAARGTGVVGFQGALAGLALGIQGFKGKGGHARIDLRGEGLERKHVLRMVATNDVSTSALESAQQT